MTIRHCVTRTFATASLLAKASTAARKRYMTRVTERRSTKPEKLEVRQRGSREGNLGGL